MVMDRAEQKGPPEKYAVWGWLKLAVNLGWVLPVVVAGNRLGWLGVNVTGRCGVAMGFGRFDCASHAWQRGAQITYMGDTVHWVSSVSPVDAALRSETKQKKWAGFQANRLFIKPLVTMIWGYNRVRAVVVLRPGVLVCWPSKTRRKLCLPLSILFVWHHRTVVTAVINSSLNLKHELEGPGLSLPMVRALSQNGSTGSQIPASRGHVPHARETPSLLVVGVVLMFACLIIRLKDWLFC